MEYFTSDLHFGHANIIELCHRPFTTVEEMDAALIANWNRRVTDRDTVYITGDLCFRTADPLRYLTKLKGKKHLILGNHDKVREYEYQKLKRLSDRLHAADTVG